MFAIDETFVLNACELIEYFYRFVSWWFLSLTEFGIGRTSLYFKIYGALCSCFGMCCTCFCHLSKILSTFYFSKLGFSY